MRYGLTILALLLALPVQADEVDYYDLLTRDAIGAREFVRKNPEWDGRQAVIAVLDTGVDMSVEGMRKTTTGEVKVIEARDFSGQGVIHLRAPTEGKEGEQPILTGGKGVVRGHDRVAPQPVAGSWLLGFLEEEKLRNSAVGDVNGNGRSSERFAILAGRIKDDAGERWLTWVDTDGDGSVEDEEPRENFAISRQHFFFRRQGEEAGQPVMAFALQLDAKRKEVVLHFADGSHGTHVAGIAAGFELFGKPGFHGIAPGAQVMSLKIGDNTLSGGSTTTESMKKALEFAGEWSRLNQRPVVVNMSYGIGTEKEGESDIDRLVDRLIRQYPLLSVATSAGNSGPGLSTVGTPAGADLLFSTGALLTRANAQGLYGTRLERDVIFYFSSRGGELGKPDGLAPGCAASSVPPWESWVTMRGTSMASPQAAGALALIAGAAAASKLQVNGGMLARALHNGGRPLPDYSLADQGAGVINVTDGWLSLQALAGRKGGTRVAGFQVKGDCPSCPDGQARTAFFRAGTYLPARPWPVSFSVQPLFMNDASPQDREGYFESFDLSVEGGDWLEPATASFFVKGDSASDLDLFIKPERLDRPGLYSALVRGTSRESGKGRKNGLFELWVVVVKPHLFDLTSGYERSFQKEVLPPGEERRYFLRVPEGAASMRVELEPAGGYTQSRLTIFDPDGHELAIDKNSADSSRKQSALALVAGEELLPGIWEVVVMTHYAARDRSHYNLQVSFSGLHCEAPVELQYDQGNPPRAFFELRALFDQLFEGRVTGGLHGISRTSEYESKSDRISFPIMMEADEALVRLKLSVDRETYARFTDCAVNVIGAKGEAVEKGGFSALETTIEVANPQAGSGGASYQVEVIGGFANRSETPWKVLVEEFHEKTVAMEAKVWCGGMSYFVVYPNRPATCEMELNDKPEILPSGFTYYGQLRFHNERTRKVDLVVPLKMRAAE